MKNYKETQRFNQWWLIILELIVSLFIAIVLIKKYQNLGDIKNEETFLSILLSGVMLLLVLIFINMIKLKTEINEKGISYQFYPLQLSSRTVLWGDLESCFVRKYEPIMEFGGWGFRGLSRKKILGFNGKGKALNIKGNIGIQLVFRDGGKLLIGTQNPEKVKLIIHNYDHKIAGNKIEG